MSQSIAIPHPRPADRERGRHHHLFASVILCLMLVAVSFGIVATIAAIVRSAASEETAATEPPMTFPPRELSRELRNWNKPLPYEHMYRQNQSPRIDWVRVEGDLKWRGRF